MKAILCLVAGVLSVTSYFTLVRNEEAHTDSQLSNEVQDVTYYDDSNMDFEQQCYILQNQFAQVFAIQKYQQIPISNFEEILSILQIKSDMERLVDGPRDRVICAACQVLVKKIQTFSLPVEIIGQGLCQIYIGLRTWTANNFCREIIELNKPHLEYIIKNSQILTPEYACSILLQNPSCYSAHPALTWRNEVPNGPLRIPREIERDPNLRPIRILHLSDFHVSHDYEINGVVDCGYPLCCKKGLGNPLRGRNAGTWGDYECDIPNWLLTNALIYIRNTHPDIQAIYYTGDIIDHTVWKATPEQNSAEIKWAFDQLTKWFPGIPVLPVLGNHEAVPLNIWPPHEITDPNLSQKWLYSLLTDIWSRWLPNEALRTVAKQGYYSYDTPNLKIIGLNSNVCYKYNWWLLYDTNYLKEQLHFLRDELSKAEEMGQYVHILSHIFPGDRECIEPWEVNYNNLITRYAHIIKGQFFGHTHTDGLKVFYSKINGEPINVGYNGASLTTHQKFNPNYKIITVDPNNYNILDVESFYFNLTEANLYSDRTPRWQKLYSITEAYDFKELTPDNFDNLAKRMSEDAGLLEKYWRNYVRNGDASLKEGCDAKCREGLILNIITTESLTST